MNKELNITVSQSPSLNKIITRKWAESNWRKRYERELKGYSLLVPKISKYIFANITITRFDPHILDNDNIVGGCKPLLDALKNEGLIYNDDPSHVYAIYLQRKHKVKSTKIEIRWFDVDDTERYH